MSDSAPRPLLSLAASVGAGAAATLVRYWFPYAWGEAGSLASVFYRGDAPTFVSYAQAIANGRAFDNGIPFHPPGWPAVLSLFLKITGGAPAVSDIKLLVALISGAAVLMTTLLAGEMAGAGAMAVAAVLATFHFGHVVEGTVPGSEALYSALVAATLLLTWRWIRGGATLRAPAGAGGVAVALVGGALAGFATLVRAEFAACALGFLLLRVRWGTRGLARPIEIAVYVAALAAALAPTTVWHWRALSAFNAAHRGRVAGPLPRFAPVTSYGAFNFAMANHENAEGGPNSDHPSLAACAGDERGALDLGALDLACPAIYDLFVHGYRTGAEWMIRRPRAALLLAVKKAAMTSGAFAEGYLYDNVGSGVGGERRRVDLLDPSSRGLWLLHVGLIAAGAWILRRSRAALALLAVPVLALAASTILFYGYVRLAVAYLPVFWVLQGTAAARLASGMAPSRRWRRRGPAIALLVGLAALVVAASSRSTPREVTIDGPRGASGQILQDETVEIVRVR